MTGGGGDGDGDGGRSTSPTSRPSLPPVEDTLTEAEALAQCVADGVPRQPADPGNELTAVRRRPARGLTPQRRSTGGLGGPVGEDHVGTGAADGR